MAVRHYPHKNNSIPMMQKGLENLNFSSECTCAIFCLNFSDFYTRSEKKLGKFLERDAYDSPGINAIYEGKFDNTEI